MRLFLKTLCQFLRMAAVGLAQILFIEPDCPLCSCRYQARGRLVHGLCDECLAFFKSLTPIKTTLAGDDHLLPELTCFSAGFYDGLLRESIYQIKYLKNKRLIALLGHTMQPPTVALVEALAHGSGQTVDILLIPVPLHKDKLKERSFNQAAALAGHVQKSAAAKDLNTRKKMRVKMSVASVGLRRVRATKPQYGLKQSERRGNLARAFAGDSKLIKGRCVIIVDDILTSGATLYECAVAATAAGAVVLGAITFGRARWQAIDRDQAHIVVPALEPGEATGRFFPETSERRDKDAHPPSARHHPGYMARL